jgi:hypothetical protein
MPRRITPTEQYRKAWTAQFLDWAMAETAVSTRALSIEIALSGSRLADRRASIGAYRAGHRIMTVDTAARVGLALNRLGAPWASSGLALYGCAYFGEWVRYLACLRRESYLAAIIATFATSDIGNPTHRLLSVPSPGLPEETNAMIHALHRDVPLSHLSRLDEAVLERATRRWFRNEAKTDILVRTALAIDCGHDAPYLAENLCVSLAVSAASTMEPGDDLAARRLFDMMYEAYYRRLPMFRPLGWPQPPEVRSWANLTVGELDAALDAHLPPRGELPPS